MKTSILTAAIVLAIALGASQSTFALTHNSDNVSAILGPVNKISKIEIHGNVELYVSEGCSDHIKIYNNDYKGAAMTADRNGVLRISSYSTQKLIVWVTASDLSNISAYDNADIESFGPLSSIDLDINLYNNASARLDMDVFHANITLNDHTKAQLAGNANEVELKHDITAFVDTTALASEHLANTEKLDKVASENL
ncbi:MAG TPA: DUF2807 domain-containing protein [Mucilaginibacter sp.]|jgi:hypothetical protein